VTLQKRVRMLVDASTFIGTDISEAYLEHFRQSCQKARERGVKMIPHFIYPDYPSPVPVQGWQVTHAKRVDQSIRDIESGGDALETKKVKEEEK
jgi:hypothetical protein